jgi:hypothetical protein
MTRIRSVIVLIAAVLLSSCTTSQLAQLDPADVYRHAVFESAVYQRDHVRELRPLTATDDGTVLVASLHAVGLPQKTLHLEGDMWVTGVPEVRDLCRTFDGDVLGRLHQLLGLPPVKKGESGYFSTIRVHASDLFRPAPDSRIDTRFPCDDTTSQTCGNDFPSNATPAHRAWIASSTLGLHRWPSGYPWTHLGYTYDWGGRGESAYGASEYIIRGGSDVDVIEVMSYTDYCKR